MKNKEIEELLNELKRRKERYNYCKKNDISFSDEDYKSYLLLSYTESLENRNKEIYEGFMATQEELTDYVTKNEQLEKENKILKENAEHNDKVVDKLNLENKQLKNNRDKAIEYVEKHPCDTWYTVIKANEDLREVKVIKHQEELINTLKGGSDE